MRIAWSSHKSKRDDTAKAKRLRKKNRIRIPDFRGISDRLPMETLELTENNLPLKENIHVDENELATSDHWKLPYKSLRPLKDNQCLRQNDASINETSLSEFRTKLEAWQFCQFNTQHPLDKCTLSSLPNLYFTDM